ncbi:MAG TPA: hypothetical protein VJY39_21705 [Acidisphaera sp.]|nr:hypothetical protein [Acidisphaera sp.]
MRALGIAVALASLAATAHAAKQEDAQAALADARQAEAQAASYGNRWLPAEAALKAAQDALAKQAWDDAIAQANRAKALAQRAVEQSRDQEARWRDAVIR